MKIHRTDLNPDLQYESLHTKLPRSMNDVHLNRLYLYMTFGIITRYYSLIKSTVLYTSYSI